MPPRTPIPTADAQPPARGQGAPGHRRRAAHSVAALALAALVEGTSPALAIDLHAFWDQRCADCHRHAGDFAREVLKEQEGELRGHHHEAGELRRFLGSHGVPKGDVDAIYAMLLAQVRTRGEFQTRCSACHSSAADLARNSLHVQDGILTGRATGRPVGDFLEGHVGLSPEDVPFFVELLARVEREVHRP